MTFTPLEIAAVVFILANVWLAIRENIWTWPTGIVGVLLYLVVNWQAHLYANAALQVLYFVLSIHGWYEWLHGGANKTERKVSLASARVWLATIVGGALLTAPIWYVLPRSGSGLWPALDAGTTAYSIVGQVLMNLKILENWVIWLIVDVIYVVIYIHQKLYLTAGLYALFVVLCVKGYLDWRRSALVDASA